MKKVFIICSVRNTNQEYRSKLESYTSALEEKGLAVHLPHRNTNQQATGLEICTENMEAIKGCSEVHVFYSGNSQGVHFDMGVAFALGKKIVIAENEPLTEGKSYQRMLTEWESR